MATQTSVPYDWLRHIPHSLLEKDEIPILSSPGPFPLDKLIAFLSKTFQLEQLEINLGQWESRPPETILKGLGAPVKCANIELSPVQGIVTWAMCEKDINALMSLILTKDPHANNTIEKEYLQGFFEFVALETLLSFNRSEYDKGLVPHLLESATVPSDGTLCSDISINCNGTTFIGRLILNDEFRHSWKERYMQHKMSIGMSPELAEKLQVVLQLEAGKTSLSRQEWATVNPGDYLPLETCSLEPGADKGRVMITMNGQMLFRAKVKQGNIKILEFPLTYEAQTPMSKDEDDEDEHTDEYFDESELDMETEEFGDDDETEEHSIVEKATPAPLGKKDAPKQQAESALKAQPAQSSKISPENIPMTVVVEVGRLQMSVQKLMDLQPGNLLELDVHPENGVDLVVCGKCIGRGELLRIGDTLGVRILDKS